MTKASGTKRLARWSIVLIANIVILLVVGVSSVRETYQGWKVDQQMKNLQGQVADLENKRLNLSDVLRKLNSLDTIDEEARARLGMQKPGEKVVVLRGTDPTADDTVQAAPPAASDDAAGSNPKRWLDYFFAH